MKNRILSLGHKRSFTWIAVLGSVLGSALILLLPAPFSSTQIVLAWVGGIWAWSYANQQRHAEDAKFMRELVKDFSERYDKMNGPLAAAVASGTPSQFTSAERELFIDYFNLCADEWLYYRKGYVDEEVWASWRSGMEQYSKHEKVITLWREEAKTNSYYGLEFPTTSQIKS